jgi:hypothetical protein
MSIAVWLPIPSVDPLSDAATPGFLPPGVGALGALCVLLLRSLSGVSYGPDRTRRGDASSEGLAALDTLTSLGCDLAQGYYLARPAETSDSRRIS